MSPGITNSVKPDNVNIRYETNTAVYVKILLPPQSAGSNLAFPPCEMAITSLICVFTDIEITISVRMNNNKRTNNEKKPRGVVIKAIILP